MKPVKQWLEWLFSEDRRQAKRHKSLPLVAYYWDGAEPVAHGILDASLTGMYLLTQQRWYPGTVVTMTLQRARAAVTDPERSIAVNAKVVRAGADGVGLTFLPTPAPDPRRPDESRASPVKAADLKTIDRFFRRLQMDTGQALVEFALCFPLVFLLIVNAVNFGGFFYSWITISDAARAGANYAALGGAAAGTPASGTATSIKAVITADTSSLTNSSSLAVSICQRLGSTVTTVSGTCSLTTTPADPESPNYTLTSVYVSYTYKPIVSGFTFPKLGIYLTIPPTAVAQRVYMRSIQ